MPDTPVHALPYPTSANAADVPADVQALAEGVEAALAAMDSQDTQTAAITATTSGVALTGIDLTPEAGDYFAIVTAAGTHVPLAPANGTGVRLGIRVAGAELITGPQLTSNDATNGATAPLVAAGLITVGSGEHVDVIGVAVGGNSGTRGVTGGRLVLIGPF